MLLLAASVRKAVFAACGLALLLAPGVSLLAQSGGGIANIAPKMPEDPNLSKVTHLRLIYVGGPKAPSVCLARAPKGQKAAIIESHIPCGTFSPYVAMKPENFTLHILDGNVTNDPVNPLPLDEKKLTDPIKVSLRPGAYSTVVVTEIDGKFSSSILADTRSAGTSPTMRVLDLSGLDGWIVRLSNSKSQPIQTLWASGQAETEVSLPASGIRYIEVLRKTPAGLRQINLFECQFDPGTPFTITLSRGPVGEGSAAFAFDACPGANYDPEFIKTLVGGTTAPAP